MKMTLSVRLIYIQYGIELLTVRIFCQQGFFRFLLLFANGVNLSADSIFLSAFVSRAF